MNRLTITTIRVISYIEYDWLKRNKQRARRESGLCLCFAHVLDMTTQRGARAVATFDAGLKSCRNTQVCDTAQINANKM